MFPPPPSQPSPQVQPPQPNPQGMGMTPMGGSSNSMGFPSPPPQVQPPMQFGGGKPMQPQVQPPMQMGGGKPMQPQVQPPMYPAAPQAQKMSQFGRGNDTMLMHVTPSEVQGLQGLAQMGGGSLTTNPMTGLPEAGFLEDLLPTILGVAGMALGIPPMLTAAVVGGGTGMATGSLEKGLMAGLGAFGGASMGGAMGLGSATTGVGATAANTVSALPNVVGGPTGLNAVAPQLTAAAQGGAAAANPLAAANTAAMLNPAAAVDPLVSAVSTGSPALTSAPAAFAPTATLTPAMPQAPAFLTDMLGQRTGQQVADFGTRFGQVATPGAGSAVSPYYTGAAALGVANPLMSAMQPRYPGPEDKDDGFNYEGPYLPTERRPRFKPPGTENDSSEFRYFDDVNPYPGFQPAPRGFAAGGGVERPPVMPPAPVGPGGVISLPGSGAGGPTRRITRPLGYGDQQNYGMRGGETRYDTFRPTLPPPPVLGGGDGGAGGGTGGGSSGGGSAGGFSGGGFGGDFGDRLRSLLAQNQAGSAPRSTEFRELDQFAAGGTVDLNRGGFVVDARTVAELGNGSSSAGQEILARYGGRPVTGGGDGVSDSVPARIDGRRPARVARDEVHFSAEAVRALGKGDAKQGTKRLNALMAKAQKARQSADRGQDTKLRKAIAK
jgi:hypothetical protein